MPLLVLLAVGFSGSPASAGNVRTDLQTALDRLDEGTALLEQHDQRSDEVLGQAAAEFQQLIDHHALRTPGIYHALGNAYMLAGDTGRGVLAYRRGEQIDPNDPALHESLGFARSRVPVQVELNTPGRLWSWVMVWRGRVPRLLIWNSFIALFTLGWLALAARTLGAGSRGLAVAGVWMLCVSLLPLTMLGLEWARYQGGDGAVVVQEGTTARTGPDDSIYEPVFTDPLAPGVEARVLETRNDWARLALGDGTECWVPRSSIELVNP